MVMKLVISGDFIVIMVFFLVISWDLTVIHGGYQGNVTNINQQY
jgi:hypothetical protein